MTITVYRSDDVDAPTLSGTASSLIGVLDACLVNGYGSKAPAGWTKPYSDTNVAVYRMSTVAPATGFYLRVSDPESLLSRIVAYETMTDANTGTNSFPTNSQVSGGLNFRKSTTTDTTVRPWMMIADNRLFYLWTFTTQTTFGNTAASDNFMMFGDIISYIDNDQYNCVIAGPVSNTASNSTFPYHSPSSYAASDMWISRDYTTTINSKVLGKHMRLPHTVGSSVLNAIGAQINLAYPDPVTGGLNLFAIDVIENSNFGIRGRIPGFYSPFGGANVGSIFDTIDGTESLSGKTFILMPIWYSTTPYRGAFQITGDWYS